MNINDYLNNFDINVHVKEKRPGIYKLLLPYYYPDGDMFDVFFECKDDNLIFTDKGITLMKLSYTFDIHTDNKMKILNKVISSYGGNLVNGSIECTIKNNNFQMYLMNFLQIITRISNMEILSRDIVKNMFYDYFIQNTYDKLQDKYTLKKDFAPLENPDLKVDFALSNQTTKKPIFIFGIKDSNKAKETVISCLRFREHNIPFKSIAVHSDMDSLTSFDRNQTIDICDKTYTSLEQYNQDIERFVANEVA